MSEDRQERFAAYVEALAEVIGHADRAAPLRDYCLGLLLPGDRKSVEPIAAATAPARVSAKPSVKAAHPRIFSSGSLRASTRAGTAPAAGGPILPRASAACHRRFYGL